MFNSLKKDVQFGLRMLIGHPGFTAISILALAIGIGANTAIFSVVNAVILRPLPYKDPENLVYVFRNQPPILQGPISRPDFFEWQNQQKVFSAIAAYSYGTFNLTGNNDAQQVRGLFVTEEFFNLFGLNPAQGRFLVPSDNEPSAGHVAVISYRMWQSRFGGDSSVIGKTISLDGETYTVVGVAQSGFNYPGRTDVWSAAKLATDKHDRGTNYLNVIGRLRDGVSPQEAQNQMIQIAATLGKEYPESDANLKVEVTPLLEAQVSKLKPLFLILLGSVALVLLIACANVANLLLARATSRQREIALKSALGATRWRIVRQLLTESILLSLFGSGLGLFFATWGIDVLVALAPEGIPRIHEVRMDKWVLGFTFATSLVTGIIFGLVPALQVSRVDLNEVLKEGSRGASGGRRRAALRSALVTAEIAVSLVLLVGAGLLIQSLRHLSRVDPGFDPHNLLTVDMAFPRDPSTSRITQENIGRVTEKGGQFLESIEQKISTLPGVVSVGTINNLPASGQSDVNGDFNVEGRPKALPGEAPEAEFRLVTPNYFHSIGIPLLEGRAFTATDNQQSKGPILINDALAKKYFPGEDPLGKRLVVLDEEPHEIIGITGSARQWGLDQRADPEVYFSFKEANFGGDAVLVVRSSVDPSSLGESIRKAISEVNHEAPVLQIKTMNEVIATTSAQRRFNATLMTVFAGVALVLAAIGLYGVISYSIAQRTQEIGIRMALGAQKTNVLRMVLWFGLRLSIIGLIAGTIVSLFITRVLRSLLYGVGAKDPLTFILGGIVLLVIALVACYVPALRAAKIDPLIALRCE